MKLELKHLVGYLPYNVKVKIERTVYPKWEHIYTLSIKELSEYSHGSFVLTPILRPLSDLTKEIEVNMEKFVPVDRLQLYGYYDEQCLEYNQVKSISHNMMQYLYEWHFDIHGLIEKNLAIDKNTL
jgi:hypothetical protein